MPNFQALFAKVMKPADISTRHIDALNIQISPPCSFEDLLPPAVDGLSYFPALEPETPTSALSDAESAKRDTRAMHLEKDFNIRLSELQVDNDIAFRILTRSLKNGMKAPKLAYMRKFFEGLETMSQYWDCSCDNYYGVSVASADGELSAKRQRLDLEQPVSLSESSSGAISDAVDAGLQEPVTTVQPHGDKSEQTLDAPAADFNLQKMGAEGKIRTDSANPESFSRMRYKGRRTSTGREMPDQFRADTVRAFVEGTVWPFQCSVALPRMMPLVQSGIINLPVRQTAAVYRLPKERARARQGRLEGPLMTIQARSEVDFYNTNGSPVEEKMTLDLMRELGGLLQIAQERRREGKTEVKPGEGKWWTTKPRWGGGPGGEAENESGSSNISQNADDSREGVKELNVKLGKDDNRLRRKKTPVMLWKELRCGSGRWDPKTDYAAIGKDPKSPYDEIFMVSSLNHHLAIVKLTVHEAYVDFFTSGFSPDPIPADIEWCRPRLQRTKWHDLFDVKDRVEAFRGLWGIMAYLTRDTSISEGVKNEDAIMGNAA